MSKTLTPSVTVRDPKGLKFIEVVSAAYNKAGLTEKEAQMVNQAGGLSELITGFLNENRYELLIKHATVEVEGAKKFVATEEIFRKEANVGYFWEDFRDNFLGKEEMNVPSATLAVHQLKKDSVDKLIRNQLGELQETTLWHFFSLIRLQSRGQEGALLTNGWANIFYIKDKKNKLWAVDCRWDSGRRFWDVSADSVEYTSSWGADSQVVSRDSLFCGTLLP